MERILLITLALLAIFQVLYSSALKSEINYLKFLVEEVINNESK